MKLHINTFKTISIFVFLLFSSKTFAQFPSPYCIQNYSYISAITNISFNTINNTSSVTSIIYHEDFTNITTAVTKNITYTLKFSANTNGSSSTNAKVFIDWNIDGDFDDAGESYLLPSLPSSTGLDGKFVQTNIIVPQSAVPGVTRMRVKYDIYNTITSSCGTAYQGQAEDYTINILPYPDCSLGGFVAGTATSNQNNICPGAYTVFQTKGASYKFEGLSYQWQSSTDNINWDDMYGATDTVYTFTNTQSNTTYYRFKVACNNNTAVYSNVIVVTNKPYTNCYCTPSTTYCDNYISSIIFAGISNGSACGTNGYSNYSSTTGTAMRGTIQPFIASGNYGAASKYMHVYIDFNQNGYFEPNEHTLIKYSSGNTFSGNIRIPFTSKVAAVKMRVVYNTTATISPYSPTCFDNSGAETEDYTLNITNNPSTAKGFVFYVKENGTGNGTSWTNAMPSISDALSLANKNDTIKVAKGTYYTGTGYANGFELKDSVAILGGYSNTGTPTDANRNWGINPTILSGFVSSTISSQNNHVVYGNGIKYGATIDGFILENGNSYSGSSIGAGIFLSQNANPIFKNCVIRNNQSYSDGSAISVSGSLPKFINCIVESNGIDYSNSDILINAKSNASFTNCIIAKNSSKKTIWVDNSKVQLINCTVVKNTNAGCVGAVNNSIVDIANSILYYNQYTVAYQSYSDDSTEIYKQFSTINIANTLTQVYNVNGFLSGFSPRFTDSSNLKGADGFYFTSDDGYQLSNPCSMAINAGLNTAIAGTSTDILGNVRIKNTTVDLGAYEVQQIISNIPKVLYVKATATGLNNGSSWANAFTNLQSAINSCSDTIKVAAGTYYPSNVNPYSYYNVENNRVILGGYPATGNPTNVNRNITANPTILDAQLTGSSGINSFSLLKGKKLDSTFVIDGFSINNAGADDPYLKQEGAIYFSICNNPIISNCSFTGNTKGVIYSSNNKALKIFNCKFYNNVANSYYGFRNQIYNYKSPNFVIKKCTFNNNASYKDANDMGDNPIVGNVYSNGTIDSCTFTQNYATSISNSSSNPTITNCNFVGNFVRESTTGMDNYMSNPIVTNCIFKDSSWNSLVTDYGGIIYNRNNSNGVFTRCQFYNGSAYRDGGTVANDSSSPTFNQCIFKNSNNIIYNIKHSNPTLQNSIFMDGTSTSLSFGDAVYVVCANSSPQITNCTFVNANTSSYSSLGFDTGSYPIISNCIFWRNFKGQSYDTAVLNNRKDISTLTPNNVTINNTITEYYGVNGINGNMVNINPRFINQENPVGNDGIWFTSDDGLQLCNCSPAINSGLNSALANATVDMNNNPRIFGGTIDMGAYEFQAAPATNTSKTSYVKASAVGANTGANWTNAFTNLQTAINNPCVDTIKMAAGIYKPSSTNRDSILYVNRNLAIFGSYPNTANPQDADRDVDTTPTILSGDLGNANDTSDNSYGLLKAYYADNISLDGLVFKDANSIGHKVVYSIYNTYTGGGFWANYILNLNINNCRFYNNYNSSNGGALDISYSKKFSVQNSVFQKNYAQNGSGVFLLSNGIYQNINNCVFNQNTASQGGGMSIDEYANTVISNCVFNNNFAWSGAAIISENNPPIRLLNCTFANNKLNGPAGYNYYGAAIYSTSQSWQGNPTNAEVKNCIFTGNCHIGPVNNVQYEFRDLYFAKNGNQPTQGSIDMRIGYSATNTMGTQYWGPIYNPSIIQYKNENNPIGPDGKWFTSDDGLQLIKCSGGMDIGANVSAITTNDFTNRPRIFNTTVDLGAYEFQGSPEASTILDNANDSLIANSEVTDAVGWTHYYKDCKYLLSLKKNGQNIGTVGTGNFKVIVKTTTSYKTGLGTDLSNALYVSPGVAWKVMNRYWKVIPTTQPTDSILVKFPFLNTDFIDVKGSNPSIATPQQMVFYKNDGQYNALDLNVPLSSFHQYTNAINPTTSTWSFSQFDSVYCANFYVKSFSGGGGGGGTGTNGGALPVALISFTANKYATSSKLHWQTSIETNCKNFEVQKSRNGGTFITVEIAAAKGIAGDYYFIDEEPYEGINYYRLKINDFDGKFNYSAIRNIFFEASVSDITIFPNPILNGELNVQTKNKVTYVTIFNSIGKIVYKSKVATHNAPIKIPIDNLSSGIYSLQISTNNEIKIRKFVKQ